MGNACRESRLKGQQIGLPGADHEESVQGDVLFSHRGIVLVPAGPLQTVDDLFPLLEILVLQVVEDEPDFSVDYAT